MEVVLAQNNQSRCHLASATLVTNAGGSAAARGIDCSRDTLFWPTPPNATKAKSTYPQQHLAPADIVAVCHCNSPSATLTLTAANDAKQDVATAKPIAVSHGRSPSATDTCPEANAAYQHLAATKPIAVNHCSTASCSGFTNAQQHALSSSITSAS